MQYMLWTGVNAMVLEGVGKVVGRSAIDHDNIVMFST